ncbi:uncharacterized protein M6B38_296710 [Iris pallida]|uniref:Uncharacterized protein n=1 Tax=Iris pallida TaxID=29817 RepID=A0AAX6HT60_IRIPA|nr:uncharacterized protein M6B38_296710 [Iris pallida]
MDSLNHDGLGGTNNSVQDVNHEAVQELFSSHSERLLGSGKGLLIKGKGPGSDMLPPLPPHAKRLRPTTPGDFTQGSAVQSIMEANQLVDSNISYGSVPSQCNEVDDASTESDELPAEGNETESTDVTKDFIHSVEGHDKSSSSNDCSVEFLASKGNDDDSGGNLNREHLDSKGLVKACSCSFCLKAAHMWTDLTFQDTRGRLTELQRSKKRTKDYIAKVSQDPSNITKSSKLEIDLLQQWTTLFQHTHDTLVQEISQTQANLEAQSKMMENCKKELERSVVFPPHGPWSQPDDTNNQI